MRYFIRQYNLHLTEGVKDNKNVHVIGHDKCAGLKTVWIDKSAACHN